MTLANIPPDRIDRVTKFWEDLDPKQRQALLDHPAVKARIGATFVPTAKQIEAEVLLDGPAVHCLLWGGSRSGKTALICRKIVQRAMRAPGSRHLVARLRFNHVIQSIWHDTMPKVLATCFPGLQCKQDKASWFWELPNGSQIWFGGLDDKERTEKVLGNEYASIFLNECSQIGLSARNTVITRLAQNIGLKLLAAYDENPPISTHWTHRLFIEKREAAQPYGKLKNPETYAHLQMNPADNAANLPATYLEELQALPARERLRFWSGQFGQIGENALWTFEGLETYRVTKHPDLRRIIVAVDPSGTKGDDGGDEVGIVVAGVGLDGAAYVIEDATVSAPPAVWGRVVVNCADRHAADCIVYACANGLWLHEALGSGASHVQPATGEAPCVNRHPHPNLRRLSLRPRRHGSAFAAFAGRNKRLSNSTASSSSSGMGARVRDRALLCWVVGLASVAVADEPVSLRSFVVSCSLTG